MTVEALVEQALDELPDTFLGTLDNVAVLVLDNGAEHRAYGLYRGGTMARPDVGGLVIVFRDTLERDFGHDPARLAVEVRRTLRHELGHHLGFDEAGVGALGL